MSDLRAGTIGRGFENHYGKPVTPARSQKGRPMWIYDGEQWIEEGVIDNESKRDRTPKPEEMQVPELQVVEIVPVPAKPNYVPFPLP
ncbi:MAG TPA: hypothetical protein VER58_08550 [Thermoanaerobaculia bacterium]|nr:hypothetical protein [Thermoanaerobaculia bacterium]